MNAKPAAAVRSLPCPYCNTEIELSEAQLIDGEPITCPFCEMESILSREWIEHEGHSRWELVEDRGDDER